LKGRLTRALIMKKYWIFLLFFSACGDGGGSGPPDEPTFAPSTIRAERVFAGVNLSAPTTLAQAPADATRWFALEQRGVVTVFANNNTTATGSTFLDISARVQFSGEAGLLGIAFHPDFANNGEVFLSYTADAPLTSRISRFRSFDGNLTLDPNSEEILLTVIQPRGNHNGGDIHFGPDGFLYAGFGDGGGAGDPDGNGQDMMSLLGSMVRIDVDVAAGYGIPVTNPFAGNANCVQGFGAASCPEIFAWGLRNPWRFSFDRTRGDLWLGDVGQSDWEEVDRVSVGGNYGWSTREGAHCYPAGSACSAVGLTDPITEYGRSVGQSITGGYVYRGLEYADLRGYYVFGDFVSGRIWAVAADSPIGSAPIELADTAHSIAAFAEGVNGELYIVDYGGTLHQLVP
jgi:glucose/arabinose dehydrogenase